MCIFLFYAGQLERIWWIVGWLWLHTGQLGSVLSLIVSVLWVSVHVLNRHLAFFPDLIGVFSSSVTWRILLRTVQQFYSSFSLLSCNHLLSEFTLAVVLVVINNLTLSSGTTTDCWILWFLQYFYQWGSTGFPWWQDPVMEGKLHVRSHWTWGQTMVVCSSYLGGGEQRWWSILEESAIVWSSWEQQLAFS